MPDGIPVFYGPAMVAQWTGVTRASISNWLRRYQDYPEPAGTGDGIGVDGPDSAIPGLWPELPAEATEHAAAIRLLEEALFIRMNGEYAPGGRENWHDWDRKAEAFLRGLLPPERENEDRG